MQEGNGSASRWQLSFQIPKDLAPVTLAFQLDVQPVGEPGRLHDGAHGSHFAVPVGMSRGRGIHQGKLLITDPLYRFLY